MLMVNVYRAKYLRTLLPRGRKVKDNGNKWQAEEFGYGTDKLLIPHPEALYL